MRYGWGREPPRYGQDSTRTTMTSGQHGSSRDGARERKVMATAPRSALAHLLLFARERPGIQQDCYCTDDCRAQDRVVQVMAWGALLRRGPKVVWCLRGGPPICAILFAGDAKPAKPHAIFRWDEHHPLSCAAPSLYRRRAAPSVPSNGEHCRLRLT